MAAASHTLLILGGAARAVPMVYPGTGVVPRASKEVVKMQTRNPGYRKGGKLSSDGGGGGSTSQSGTRHHVSIFFNTAEV